MNQRLLSLITLNDASAFLQAVNDQASVGRSETHPLSGHGQDRCHSALQFRSTCCLIGLITICSQLVDTFSMQVVGPTNLAETGREQQHNLKRGWGRALI
jgi:hypothetical protein